MEKKCQAEQAGLKDPKAQEDHQLVKRIIALPQEKLLTPKDIVSVGIGQSVGRLGLMRLRGEGPKFICIPRRTYLYAPCDVIAWLRTCQDTITPPNVPKSKRVYPKQAKNAPGRSV